MLLVLRTCYRWCCRLCCRLCCWFAILEERRTLR